MATPKYALQVLDWFRAQDVGIDDVSLKKQYQSLIENGQYSEALLLLIKNSDPNGNDQLVNKIFEAGLFNIIINGIVALEQVYYNNVDKYLDILLQEFTNENLSANFKIIGDWVPYENYKALNFVYFEDNLYMAVLNNMGVQPNKPVPSGETVWINLGQSLNGVTGTNAIKVNFQGNWNSNITYKQYDLVVYQNNLYVCSVAQSLNKIPGISTDWQLFVDYKSQIFIGVNSPGDMAHYPNAVWFQTATNPLTTTSSSVTGVFKVWQNNKWVEYYPQAIVVDLPVLNQAKVVWSFSIPFNGWNNNQYIIKYPWLNDYSVVTILPDKPMDRLQEDIYNNLSLSFVDGEEGDGQASLFAIPANEEDDVPEIPIGKTSQIILTTKITPTVALNIKVTVQ